MQYFERGVFEYHPELKGTPNEVLLSLLGSFSYKQRYGGGGSGGSGGSGSSTQLSKNPSCQEVQAGNKPDAWTDIEGNQWNCTMAGQGDFPPTHDGKMLFYAGSVAKGALEQSVNVSTYAASIAEGKQSFRFSGWVSVYPQSPSDLAQIVVEYRDAGDSRVLATFTSDERSDTQWARLEDTRIAPAGTGWIRVRLIAKRQEGLSNDGYFDDLSLTAVAYGSSGSSRASAVFGHVGANLCDVAPSLLPCWGLTYPLRDAFRTP